MILGSTKHKTSQDQTASKYHKDVLEIFMIKKKLHRKYNTAMHSFFTIKRQLSYSKYAVGYI